MAIQPKLVQLFDSELQPKAASGDRNKDQAGASQRRNVAGSETKFLRLVDRVIAGGVVSFLGAGL
jgi:hypothetical protein